MSARNRQQPNEAPRLVLVRHGQASLGAPDYDRLSDLGQRQAGQIGRRLAPLLATRPVLWSGTHRRHHQTVAGLAADLEAKSVPGLDEFNTFGLARAAVGQAEELGLTRPDSALLDDPRNHLDQLLAWFPEVLGAWQDGRLSSDEFDGWPIFRDRVLSPVEQWRQAIAAGRSVLVVSSAGVISTLVAELTGAGLERQRQLVVAMYNGAISELHPTAQGWRAGRVNCVEHLEGEGLVTLA